MEGKILPSPDSLHSRIQAKNFMITYPEEVPSQEITEKLSNVFKSSKILERVTNKGCGKEFLVSMNRKKNLTSMKKLTWKSFTPIVRPVLSAEKFSCLEASESQGTLEALGSFLSTPNEADAKILEKLLREELQHTNIVIHSEYLLSSLFNSHLVYLGRLKKWENFKLFSIDSKIERVEGQALKNFRADTICIVGGKLIIIEYKFRFDRVMEMGSMALKCLMERKYGDFVYKHLDKYYHSISKDLTGVVELGIGYCVKKSEVHLSIKFNEYNFV